jgi:LCP family protein required for cell wall assembly
VSRFRPRGLFLAPSGLRRDRVVRSAFLGLLTYALGLIPFYFLTPVHDSVQVMFSRPKPGAVAPAWPTPSIIQREKKAGAELPSITDSTPQPRATFAPVPTQAPSDPRFAVLLLGYGGGNHDGAYLTDSMMVVIVDPDHKTLTLLSLPRDSWVPLLFDGQTPTYDKVNTAYAFAKDPSLFPDRLEKYTGDHGPGTFAMDTVSRLLGIPVTYYLTLDFDGFRQAINAVGGIDVNVPVGFIARYPANDDPSIDPRWTTIRFYKGMQHMTGERAIEYARARETLDDSGEGSDFARSRRQRLIIEAFKTRLFQPGGLLHLPQLLTIASQHVDTNYAIPAVSKLSELLLDWKSVKFYQTALTANNYLEAATGPDGAYLLVPSFPDHSWAQIRAFSRRVWSDPATGVEMAATTVIVENDSGVPGLAGRVSDDLMRLGYNVGTPMTGPVRARSRLVDKSAGAATLVAEQLGKDLGIDLSEVSDDAASTSNELVLQLGSDDADLSLTVAPDDSAPFSIFGVDKFGTWAPYVPPTPTLQRSPPPTATRLATGAPKPEGSPSTTGTPVNSHPTPAPTATYTVALHPTPTPTAPLKRKKLPHR